MNPQKIIQIIRKAGVDKMQMAEYNTFVCLRNITMAPPGKSVIFIDRKRNQYLVATTANSNQLLSWIDWNKRISSIEYSGTVPDVYYPRNPEAAKTPVTRGIDLSHIDLSKYEKNRSLDPATYTRRDLDTADIKYLKSQGMRVRDIAAIMGVSAPAIMYHLKKP